MQLAKSDFASACETKPVLLFSVYMFQAPYCWIPIVEVYDWPLRGVLCMSFFVYTYSNYQVDTAIKICTLADSATPTQYASVTRLSPAFRVRVWLHETKVRYGTIIIIVTLNKYFIIQVNRHCTCETLNNLCQYTIIVQYLAM